MGKEKQIAFPNSPLPERRLSYLITTVLLSESLHSGGDKPVEEAENVSFRVDVLFDDWDLVSELLLILSEAGEVAALAMLSGVSGASPEMSGCFSKNCTHFISLKNLSKKFQTSGSVRIFCIRTF